jgi:hypothetical protein
MIYPIAGATKRDTTIHNSKMAHMFIGHAFPSVLVKVNATED